MKYLLSKSLPVILINFFTALCVILLFSNVVYSFQMTGSFQDGLSHNYCLFTVLQNNGTSQVTSIASLLKRIDDIEQEVTLLRYDGSNECGVYRNMGEFEVVLQEGRSFSSEDFRSMRNVALVAEEQLPLCIERGNIRYISIQGNNYEVIGVFQRSTNSINSDAYVYYNLNSAFLRASMSSLDGQFAIDAGTMTKKIFDSISQEFPLRLIFTGENMSFGHRLQIAIYSQPMAIFPFALIATMILLNSINTSFNWLDKRKQELSTRRICGATVNELFLLLIRDYFLLVTASYIAGLTASVALAQLPIIRAIGASFSPITIVLSFFATIFSGFLSVVLMLVSATKKTIAVQRRIWT